MESPSHFIDYEDDYQLLVLQKDHSFASFMNNIQYSFQFLNQQKTFSIIDEEPQLVRNSSSTNMKPNPVQTMDSIETLEQSTDFQTPGHSSSYGDSASGSDVESPQPTCGSYPVEDKFDQGLMPLIIPDFADDVHKELMSLLEDKRCQGAQKPKKTYPKRRLPQEYEEDVPVESAKGKNKSQKVSPKTQKKTAAEPSSLSRMAEKTSSQKKQSKPCDEKRAKSQAKNKKSAASKSKSKLSIPMTKNYKGIVSAGLARLLLEADLDLDSGLYQILLNLIQDEIQNHQELQRVSVEDFFNDFMDYIKKEMYGKSIKQTLNGKKSEAFKVGNVANILRVFYPQLEDSPKTKSIKRVLRTLLVDYFFESKYYYECITRWCKAKPQGKLFLWLKISEIKKVFENPSGDLIEFGCENTALLGVKNFPIEDFIDFMKVFVPICANTFQN